MKFLYQYDGKTFEVTITEVADTQQSELEEDAKPRPIVPIIIVPIGSDNPSPKKP